MPFEGVGSSSFFKGYVLLVLFLDHSLPVSARAQARYFRRFDDDLMDSVLVVCLCLTASLTSRWVVG